MSFGGRRGQTPGKRGAAAADDAADVCSLQDTADYIRPISFSLRFKINDTESGPVLDEGWPTTVKKSVSGTPSFIGDLHPIWSPSNLLLRVRLCRSSSLKTAARMTCARQTWCYRLTWTSPDRGRDRRRSSALSSPTSTRLEVNAGCVSPPRRQQPYVIRSPRRRLAVEVQLQNRLENAYNTSLTLHYSKNLHFSSLSIRVKTRPAPLQTRSAPFRFN